MRLLFFMDNLSMYSAELFLNEIYRTVLRKVAHRMQGIDDVILQTVPFKFLFLGLRLRLIFQVYCVFVFETEFYTFVSFIIV